MQISQIKYHFKCISFKRPILPVSGPKKDEHCYLNPWRYNFLRNGSTEEPKGTTKPNTASSDRTETPKTAQAQTIPPKISSSSRVHPSQRCRRLKSLKWEDGWKYDLLGRAAGFGAGGGYSWKCSACRAESEGADQRQRLTLLMSPLKRTSSAFSCCTRNANSSWLDSLSCRSCRGRQAREMHRSRAATGRRCCRDGTEWLGGNPGSQGHFGNNAPASSSSSFGRDGSFKGDEPGSFGPAILAGF